MSTVALWILITTSSGHRPAVVIDRFASKPDCLAAKADFQAQDSYQSMICVQAKVVRP